MSENYYKRYLDTGKMEDVSYDTVRRIRKKLSSDHNDMNNDEKNEAELDSSSIHNEMPESSEISNIEYQCSTTNVQQTHSPINIQHQHSAINIEQQHSPIIHNIDESDGFERDEVCLINDFSTQ